MAAKDVRTFNGTSDGISLSAGGLVGMTYGTMLAVVRITNVDYRSFVGVGTSSFGDIFGLGNATAPDWYMFSQSDYSMASGAPTVANGWVIAGMTKTAGASSPIFYKYVFSTTTWTNTTGNSMPAPTLTPLGLVCIGRTASFQNYWQGDIAGVAIWKDQVLTGTQIQTLAANWDAWQALSPTAMWVLNQGSTATAITDLTGGGANQTALAGTTVTAGTAPIDFAPAVTVYSDDFNRADNAALGTPWVHVEGGTPLSISGNRAILSAGNGGAAARYNQTFSNDQWAEGDVENVVGGGSGNSMGPAVRMNGANAGVYYVNYDSNTQNVDVWRRDASNNYAQALTTTSTTGMGGKFKARLEAQGTTISLYLNDVLAKTGTESTVASGQPGLWAAHYGAIPAIDNFRCGNTPYVAGPPYVVATTSNGGNGINSVPVPAGGQAGDYYVIFVQHPDLTSTPPTFASTGFTSQGVSGATGGVGGYWYGSVLTKPWAGGESGSFAISGYVSWAYANCVLVRGSSGAFTMGTYAKASAVTVNIPGITVPTADSLGLISTMTYDGVTTIAAATWTKVTNGTYDSCHVLSKTLPSGATGAVTVSGGSGNATAGFMLSCAPAGAPTTTPVSTSRATTWNVAALVPKVAPGRDTTYGSGTSTTSNTTVTCTHGVVDVGETLIMAISCDNVTNASSPTVSSISKAAGETNNWVLVGSHNSSSATGAAGVRGFLYAITATTRWAAATQTITFSAAITAKAAESRVFYGVTTTARGTVPTGTTNGAGVSTGGAPTATTSGTAPASGDLVLGVAAHEANTAPGLDVDTTNGSWVAFGAGTIANTGTTATSAAVRGQYKIVTAAGNQTLNPTCTGDSGVAVVALVPQVLLDVSTSRGTTWNVAAALTPVSPASRTTTWNVAAPTITSFTDNFNRADGALGSSWAALSGIAAPVISSNHVIVTGTAADNAATVPGLTGTNQWGRISASLGPTYSEAGVILHAVDSVHLFLFTYVTDGEPYGPGIFGSTDGPALQVYVLYAAGPVWRFLGEMPGPAAGTHVIYGINIGRTFQYWFDGVRVFNIDDSAHSEIGLVGEAGFTIHRGVAGTETIVDDFAGGSYAVAPSAPTLTSFTPSSAIAGTTVAVVGTNFLADATMVTIDGVGYAVTVTSATTGSFVIPAHAPATLSVTSTTPGGTSSGLSLTISSGTTPVSTSRTTTWESRRTISPVTSRTTTWNLSAAITPAAQRTTTWEARRTFAPATTRTTTWNVSAAVTPAAQRQTTWANRANISPAAQRTTTWKVDSQPIAQRTTTWNVAGALTTVSTSRTTTWKVDARPIANRTTTWNTAAPTGTVSVSRGTSWDTLRTLAAPATRTTTWDALRTLSPVVSRATTWNTYRTVVGIATRTTTWDVLRVVVGSISRTTTWDVLRPVVGIQSRTTTWVVLRPVVGIQARTTTWEVLVPPGTVTVSRTSTWNVIARVTPVSRGTTWAVLRPVVGITTRVTTWDTLRTIAPATRTTLWAQREEVKPFRQTTWAVYRPVVGTIARTTTWDDLQTIAPVTRATTWNVLSPGGVTVSRAATWAVLRPLQQSRQTTWRVFAPTTFVTVNRTTLWTVRFHAATSRTTTWKVLPGVPQHDYLTLYPNTVMYKGEHLVKALYQGSTKIWP